MKSIKYEQYNSDMGILIDVENPITFKEDPLIGAINIPYEKLLYGHEKYLDKNKRYFIICRKNILSKKVVSVLTLYGYNITQVLK